MWPTSPVKGLFAAKWHDPRVATIPDPGADLTGYPVTPPPLPGPALFEQRWMDLAFLHWPVEPTQVAHLYPAGTRPDLFADGITYVGLVPFRMGATKLGVVPLPYFGTFLETNVRLYSVDDEGRHGVLFRSLETTRSAVVPLIRSTLGVPYSWAAMRMSRSADQVSYESRRRWPGRGLSSRVTIRVGGLVQPTPLEVWLTARWGAHTRKASRTWWIPNEHEPWSFRSAAILELDDELVSACGARPAGQHLRALFSPGVRARFGRPLIVR